MDLHTYHVNLMILQMGDIIFLDILEMVTVNFDHQCFTHFGGLKQFFGGA